MSTKKSAEERAAARFPVGKVMDWTRRQEGYATCIREEVEPLEAEVAKLRALVQRLVDALGHIEVPRNLLTDKVKAAILAIDAAKELGFVPTNTTQDNG